MSRHPPRSDLRSSSGDRHRRPDDIEKGLTILAPTAIQKPNGWSPGLVQAFRRKKKPATDEEVGHQDWTVGQSETDRGSLGRTSNLTPARVAQERSPSVRAQPAISATYVSEYSLTELPPPGARDKDDIEELYQEIGGLRSTMEEVNKIRTACIALVKHPETSTGKTIFVGQYGRDQLKTALDWALELLEGLNDHKLGKLYNVAAKKIGHGESKDTVYGAGEKNDKEFDQVIQFLAQHRAQARQGKSQVTTP